MKNLRLKMFFSISGVLLSFSTAMWMYHVTFFRRNPSQAGDGLPRFILVVVTLTLLTCAAVLLKTREATRTLALLKEGKDVPPEQKEKVRLEMIF